MTHIINARKPSANSIILRLVIDLARSSFDLPFQNLKAIVKIRAIPIEMSITALKFDSESITDELR